MNGGCGAPAYGGGPGDRFIASKAYQQIRDPGGRGQSWTTGPVEVSSTQFLTKGTLLETTAGGPGGGLVPPLYEPGVVSRLLEPLGVADVFGSSQVTASQVRYVVEGTATNAAAGVAEAGTKPESTLVLSETIEAVRKIATVLPVSDEMLEDSVSVQSYLNGRLSLFVKVEEERQLLRGLGSGSNELLGLRPVRDQHVHEARGGRQRGGAREGDRQHPRQLVPAAGHGDHPPDQLAEHPPAA